MYTKTKDQIRPSEFIQMSKLHSRSLGTMWMQYKQLNKSDPHKIALAKYGKKIVGWGIRYRECDVYEIQLFVSHKHRRKGIGTKIVNRLLYKTRKVTNVFRHDERASKFFKSITDKEKTNV